MEGQPVSRRFSWSSALRARHAAIPAEHGAWVFFFTPLAIGLSLSQIGLPSLLFVWLALATFLIRQPVTLVVKAYSGRRPKTDLLNAGFWFILYGAAALAALTGLVVTGYTFIFWLVIPVVPVMAWHLWLVSRRAERRQALMEITAAGVLALAAPAVYWVGNGQMDFTGWLLWLLCWVQVAGTILHTYLRLEQRVLKQIPTPRQSFRMARTALVYSAAAFLLVLALAAAGWVSPWLLLAYLIQPAETLWGALHPAVGVKPKIIGFRQLFFSILFTIVFILAW